MHPELGVSEELDVSGAFNLFGSYQRWFLWDFAHFDIVSRRRQDAALQGFNFLVFANASVVFAVEIDREDDTQVAPLFRGEDKANAVRVFSAWDDKVDRTQFITD